MHTMNIVKEVNEFTHMTESAFEEFCNERGPHILIGEDDILFEDGARIEYASTDHKQLYEPPTDKYQLSLIKELYWDKQSKTHQRLFDELKAYMGGNGFRPEAVLQLEEEERFDYLDQLLEQAKRSRAKLLRVRRDIQKYMPESAKMERQSDADELSRKHELQQRLDRYQL